MKKFALATVRKSGGRPFVGVLAGNRCVQLGDTYKRYTALKRNRARLTNPGSVLGLLGRWERNFEALVHIVEFATSIVLARLLLPEDFGIVAVVARRYRRG